MAGVLDMKVDDLLARARTGLDWWTGELAAMAAPLLKPVGRGRGGLFAVADATGYPLYRDGQQAGHADPGRPVEAALKLPETVALVRETPAPGLGERDWRRILMDEVDRLTPFAPADVYVTLTFVGEGNYRVARLAFAPRGRLEDAVVAARAGGVSPNALLTFAPDGSPVDLLPAVRAVGGEGPRYAARTWWGAVALLLVLNLGVAIWRDIAQTQRLEVAVAEVQPAAERIRRLHEAIEAEAARRGDLLARRFDTDPLSLLDRLTTALPPTAYVDRFDLEGRNLGLAGRRGIDVDVAAALRGSGLRDVRDASPDLSSPTADTSGAVPFDLTARLSHAVGAIR